jgi:hypothetical protein
MPSRDLTYAALGGGDKPRPYENECATTPLHRAGGNAARRRMDRGRIPMAESAGSCHHPVPGEAEPPST